MKIFKFCIVKRERKASYFKFDKIVMLIQT